MFQILSKQELAQGTVVANEIMAPRIAAKAKPGQFIILRVNETGERIPLTMADTDPNKGTITIIYQVVGKTTALLKSLNVMDHIMDIAGPLGSPTPIEKKGTILCVGGGTGVAVLHPRNVVAGAHDEVLLQGHRGVRHPHHGQPQRPHGRRHRHVRLLPGGGGRRNQVRLR